MTKLLLLIALLFTPQGVRAGSGACGSRSRSEQHLLHGNAEPLVLFAAGGSKWDVCDDGWIR